MQVYVNVLLLLVTVHCLVGFLLHTANFLASIEANACTAGQHAMLCMLGMTRACCARCAYRACVCWLGARMVPEMCATADIQVPDAMLASMCHAKQHLTIAHLC